MPRALNGADAIVRAAGQRKRAAQHRTQAAEHRALAAQDRQAAEQDRAQAARERLGALLDRQALARQLALAETHPLTGAHAQQRGGSSHGRRAAGGRRLRTALQRALL
jgi:hypothetical protein